MARATIPLGGKLLTPDQIARTAVFLASDDVERHDRPPDSACGIVDRGQRVRAARRSGSRFAGGPSQAAAARSRCCRRRSGAGTGRSAGSRSRSPGAAAPGRVSVTLLPSSRMSPSVMSIIRLTIRIAVVLPQPDGPRARRSRPQGPRSSGRRWRARAARGSAWRRGRTQPWRRLPPTSRTTAPLDGRCVRRTRETATGRGTGAGGRIYRLRSGTGGAARGRVGRVLEPVVERRQRSVEAERRLHEPVREPGVLRQQRAVEVGPDDGAVARRPRTPRAPSFPWPRSTRPSG